MTTVDLEQQRLLIGGEWVEASGGGTFERSDPFTGDTVTRAAAAGRDDAAHGRRRRRRGVPRVGRHAAGERRSSSTRAADLLMEARPTSPPR